jgi:hypothetical protein
LIAYLIFSMACSRGSTPDGEEARLHDVFTRVPMPFSRATCHGVDHIEAVIFFSMMPSCTSRGSSSHTRSGP